MSSTRTQPNPRVASAISEQCDTAGEQIARVLEERFAELGEQIEQEASAEASERARREMAEEFNQSLRRLHGCQTDEEWRIALVDACAGFCTHAALLSVANGSLAVERVRALAALGVDGTPLKSAPAIEAAIESGGAVVTLTSAAEISGPIANMLQEVEAAKCAIVPVTAGGRTDRVLVAAGDGLDVNGLEAISVLAATALERRERGLARNAAEEPGPPLTKEEEAARLRARRFALVRAAEIRLYKAQAVQDGRARRKLYLELKEEIDAARVAYARQFLHVSPTMPDYLHQELLRTLANDEVAVLGEEYPGPLV